MLYERTIQLPRVGIGKIFVMLSCVACGNGMFHHIIVAERSV